MKHSLGNKQQFIFTKQNIFTVDKRLAVLNMIVSLIIHTNPFSPINLFSKPHYFHSFTDSKEVVVAIIVPAAISIATTAPQVNRRNLVKWNHRASNFCLSLLFLVQFFKDFFYISHFFSILYFVSMNPSKQWQLCDIEIQVPLVIQVLFECHSHKIRRYLKSLYILIFGSDNIIGFLFGKKIFYCIGFF